MSWAKRMGKTALMTILLTVVLELVGLAQVNNGTSNEVGFDPYSFSTRLDSNGNRMLDTDEMQGPARLVPGFSKSTKERIPVLGFGVHAELPKIKVEERDLREADERLRRYDRNGDHVLDEDELKDGRWEGSPMQFDRDRDGRLSQLELALRCAQRRTSIPPVSMRRDSQDATAIPKRVKDVDRNEKEKLGLFDKRSSYRTGDKDGIVRLAALPDWFINLDANRDKQISMNETGWKWNEDTLTAFFLFDINRDGYITSKECMIANRDGYTFGALDRTPP